MRLRSLGLLSAAALAAVTLAGCSSAEPEQPQSTGAPADLCAAAVDSGAAVDGVTVEGEPGKPSTATFEAPVELDALETRVIEEGDGEPTKAGQYVSYALTAYDASTGDKLGEAGYKDGELLPAVISPDSILGQLFGCATPGTRVVSALPSQNGQAAAQIYVLDLLGVTPTAAWGEEQAAPDGLPAVELGENGTPAITIPDGMKSPESTELAVLKQGDGAVVEAGDTVLVQYAGVKLSDGSEFDSSWSRGAPATFQTTGVVEGFKKALEGQQVGSQVLAVIPPAEGYGEGELNDKDLKGETLVFVVDILGTQHPAAPAGEAPAE